MPQPGVMNVLEPVAEVACKRPCPHTSETYSTWHGGFVADSTVRWCRTDRLWLDFCSTPPSLTPPSDRNWKETKARLHGMLPLGQTRRLVSFLHPCSSEELTENFNPLKTGKAAQTACSGALPAMGHPQDSSEPRPSPFRARALLHPYLSRSKIRKGLREGLSRRKGTQRTGALVRGCFLHGLSSRKSPLVADTMHEDYHLMRKLVSAM